LTGAKSAEAAGKGALPHVMDINGYLNEIRALAASGQATEHSYRPALERLFTSIDPALTVINEPKQSAVGARDSKMSIMEHNNVSDMDISIPDSNENIRKTKFEVQLK
jgi:hypothetical protein